ncbi:MAG: sugar ABC transporter substrate-binding protein [Parasporobacterium sp.]|nr:sugar ABC transporter substrate-binding protein [Parasporobacterium sp.]
MKLRKLIAVLLCATLVLGFGAMSASAYEVTEINVNIWDNNQLAGLQTIADKWSETSGVKVNINVIDWDNYWTLLAAGAQGGTMPDVFWMHSNTASMYMEEGLLLNLDEYIAADESMDLSRYYEGITTLYSMDGSQYAIPKDHDTIALLYNEAIFNEYGVDVPTDDWNWGDVAAATKAITEASGGKVYGYAMNTSNNQDGWYNLIEGYGGKVITEDHKGTTIGSDEGKAGMEMMRQILEYGVPQTSLSESGTDQQFISGTAAMISQGSWMINAFYTADNAADFKWVMLPYCDANGNGQEDPGERVSAYNGLGWAAAYNVADPQACYDLISYFCSEEGQKMQAELGVTMAGMPGISDAFASAFEGMDVSAFTKIEETGTLFFRPYTQNTPVWEDAIQQQGAFLDAWLDPTNPEAMATACDNAQAIIENAIAQEW